MIYDSVHVFARGLDAVSREGPELKIRWKIVILTMPMVVILLLTFNPSLISKFHIIFHMFVVCQEPVLR